MKALKKNKQRIKEVKRDSEFKGEKGFYTNIVEELRVEDTKTYEEMLRMNYDTFKFILKAIEQDITPIALMSGGLKTISPGEGLTLTLRYLATGESRSLFFQFRISRRTISYIIQEVCRVIIKSLSGIYLRIPDTAERWNNTAEQFSLRWNFPNTIGAIDGKHITIQKPASGGSFYYNYKHTHSIVLMAVAGPDYECICADVGANGRCSDGRIWSNSNLSKQLEENSLGIPGPKNLTNSNSTTPYVYLGDDAFALETYLMKPYPQRGLTVE